MRNEKRRAPSFPKAPFLFDGGKPNSVPSPSFVDESLSRFASATKLELGDDHLSSSPSFASDASKIDIFIHETGAGRDELSSVRVRRTRGSTDRLSSLCFVLHRMGFFLPRELLRER
jgi:hypothetical protein